jgi:hypothetical protein
MGALKIHDKANRLQIILNTIQTENTEAISTASQTGGAVRVKEHVRTYKYKGKFGLMDSDMPVVAALSMLSN